MRKVITSLICGAALAALFISSPSVACDRACSDPDSKYTGSGYLAGDGAIQFRSGRHNIKLRYVDGAKAKELIKKKNAEAIVREKKTLVSINVTLTRELDQLPQSDDPRAGDGGRAKDLAIHVFQYTDSQARAAIRWLNRKIGDILFFHTLKPIGPSARATVGEALDGKYAWEPPPPVHLALLAEAEKWIGAGPDQLGVPRSLWCADAVNKWASRVGLRGTGDRWARSFADWGVKAPWPQPGVVAVFSRGPKYGHVGVVRYIKANGNPVVVSGNHGGKVRAAEYSKHRVISYRLPLKLVGA